LEKTFDLHAGNLAKSYGYDHVPYEMLTKIVLLIYLVLTSFAMFFRPDFTSITAVVLGIYAVQNPENITRFLFR
jgi:hypothetical protein